jgi:ABC-type amino acid transport substrate-binding protein
MAKSKKSNLSPSLILALAVVLALAGGFVGGKAAAGGTSSKDSNTSASFIDGIKKRGELRVGVAEAAPLTTMKKDADGVAGGPMTLPMQQLAKELGVKYVPVATTWANIVAGIQANRYDVAAYLDNTLERAKAIQFTDPVLTYQAVFVVRADSPYSSSEQVIKSGKPVAIAQGTAYTDRLKAAGAKLLEVDSTTNALAALKAGRAAAYGIDLPTAEGAVQGDPGLKIIIPKPVIYQSGSGYGVPENTDERSLQLMNIAIRDAQDYGDLATAFDQVGFREIADLGDWQKK